MSDCKWKLAFKSIEKLISSDSVQVKIWEIPTDAYLINKIV